MAVQAQYPSNAFSPDLRSRVQANTVLVALQMWPNREHQTRHYLLPSMRQQALIDDGEQQPTETENINTPKNHPHIEPTYNVSGSGRWSRDVALSSMAAAATALPQQPGFPNPAFVAVPSAVGSPMSVDQRLRVFESAGTSTSGRPENVSAQSGASFSQELLTLIRNHNVEIDTILNNYKNMLREGIEVTQKRHWKSLLAMLEQIGLKRLREKDAELESANRINSELEEKILQLCSENQMWFNLASQNEALASNLNATLEHVLLKNAAAEAASPPVMEGYGDTDGTPLPANDAQSCFKKEGARRTPQVDGDATMLKNEDVRSRMVCKVCQEKEVSVLVLHCRHLCLCKECETKVDMCPICNSLKSGSVQIFMR